MTLLASTARPGFINGRLSMCYTTNTGGINTVLLPTNTRTVSVVNTLIKPAALSPGSNVSTVTITGQTGLLVTDAIDAWIQGNDTTASHNAYEHKIAGEVIKLAVQNVVAGAGFDIIGLSECRLTGDFKVRWAWAR